MNNSVASIGKKVKRRWAFSRKKISDGKIIVSALAVTGAVFALSFTLFEYRNDAPPGNIQKSVLYHIDSRTMPEFFRQLELRDPENIFRSSLNFLPERQSPGSSLYTEKLPEIKNVEELKNTPFQKLTEYSLPVTAKFFTHPEPQEFFPAAVSKVMDSFGKEVFSIGFPAGLSGKNYRKNTIIQINRSGENIRQMRIIVSCGVAELDQFALKKLSSRDLPGGTYAVLWGEPDNSALGGQK